MIIGRTACTACGRWKLRKREIEPANKEVSIEEPKVLRMVLELERHSNFLHNTKKYR